MGYMPFFNFNSFKPFFSGFRYPALSRFNCFGNYIPFNNYRPSFGGYNSFFPSLFGYQRPAALQSSYKPFGSYSLARSSATPVSSVVKSGGSKVKAPSVSKAGWGNVLSLSEARLTQMGFNTAEKQWAFRQLKPEMQHAVLKLTEYAESQGIKIGYSSKRSIFRTRADQEALYRTSRKGYAAKPGSSRHEIGEAVDIHITGANSHDKNDPKFKKLGEFWKSMGYTWGGDWKSACEPWHFDLRPNKRLVA